MRRQRKHSALFRVEEEEEEEEEESEEMDFLPHALQQKVRKGVYALKGLSECEQLVLEATDKEKWGPHGEMLKSIAQRTVDEEEARRKNSGGMNEGESETRIILRVLFENRLKKKDLEWRLCYKALTVIDFLIANGSETIVREITRRIGRDLQPLKTFEHRDPEKGRDEGINIRQKVTTIIALLEDPERVKEVREKARVNRGKYSGMSNEDLKAASRAARNANDTYTSNRATYDNNDSVARVTTSSTMSATTTQSATTPASSTNKAAQSGTSAMSNVLDAFQDNNDDDDDDDNGDDDGLTSGGGNQQRSKGPPSFVPKVVIRDAPIPRSPNPAGFSATLKPPPKGGNAFVSANSTNLFFESQPASNTRKSTTASSTISLDDLLGVGVGGEVTSTNHSSSTGTPYQSAEDLFGFEANVSKPQQLTQHQPRAQVAPAPAVVIDDLFFGMESTPTPPIAQPAVMPKDPFSDFAAVATTPSKINFPSNNNSLNNNNNKKADPLDALDLGLGSLGLK